MAFGFFHNVFKYAASAFAKAKLPFVEAVRVFKEFKVAPDKLTYYRIWKESRVFAKKRPFVEKWPDTMILTSQSITKTHALLTNRFQYIVETAIKSSDKPVYRVETMSLLSDIPLSKWEVYRHLASDIIESEQRSKYGKIEFLNMEVIGVRRTTFL